MAGRSVRESISNCFARDPVGFILNHCREVPLPAFNDHDRWRAMMRASIEMSQWGFSSHRMVRDYFYNLYRAAMPGAVVPVG